jgi:Protocatechuate 3,4-dioxygenase beta subunit
MKSLLLTSILVSLFFITAPTRVLACSCGGKPTVLEEFDFSKVVVAGRIDSVQRLRPDEGKYDYGAILSATLVVDKVYKGNIKVGDTLVLAQTSGSDCGFEWNEGQIGIKYLFYLGAPSETYHEKALGQTIEGPKVSMYVTSFCGRSTGLDHADDDLAFLDNLERLKGKTRVSGELYFSSNEKKSVEGIEVRFKGKDSLFKTKYLKAGFFEIYDVPPGEYVIEVIAPRGWKVGEHLSSYGGYFMTDYREGLGKNERRITIKKAGHVGIDLSLIPDTNISGRVLSPAGKGIGNVLVTALTQEKDNEREKYHSWTDEKGMFMFEDITPGTYALIVNNRGTIDSEHPFERVFYPGVFERGNASVIVVEPGRYNTGLDIHVPQINRLIQISGKIEFANGVSVGDESVIFRPENNKKFHSIETRADSQGRFTLDIPFEAAGTLAGRKNFWKNDYSCPQIIAAREAAKSESIETSLLSITGIEPLTNALLKFPFDFCEKEDKK